MKKLYTFSALALLALAASAQGSPAATSIYEIAGDYEWSYYGLNDDDQGWQSAIVSVAVANAETGEIAISNMVGSNTGLSTPIKATVNLADGTVTLPNKQNLGWDKYDDINYFYIKEMGNDGYPKAGAYEGESITGTIDGSVITFSDNYVFAVGDYRDEDYGFWLLTGNNKFTLYAVNDGSVDLSEWTEIATGTMYDGWILPGMKNQSGEYYDIENYPLAVTIARNNENENLLLIENPYVESISGFPAADGSQGNIVIDISDPEFVLVNPGVFSGVKSGDNPICCVNIEGVYVDMGWNKQLIQIVLSNKVSKWSSVSVDEDGTTVIEITTCRYQYLSNREDLFAWPDREDAMKAKITFKEGTTGIDNVLVSGSDAPAEYFNIQGQRIDNPAKGQLVIKRQGNTASKMIVR